MIVENDNDYKTIKDIAAYYCVSETIINRIARSVLNFKEVKKGMTATRRYSYFFNKKQCSIIAAEIERAHPRANARIIQQRERKAERERLIKEQVEEAIKRANAQEEKRKYLFNFQKQDIKCLLCDNYSIQAIGKRTAHTCKCNPNICVFGRLQDVIVQYCNAYKPYEDKEKMQ